jgi:hypothetical protein
LIDPVTVRIIFMGLVAYVPIQYKGEQGPSYAYTILLPDSNGSQLSSDGCRLPQHVPALYVAARSCMEGCMECDKTDASLEDVLGKPSVHAGLTSSPPRSDDHMDRHLEIVAALPLSSKQITFLFSKPPTGVIATPHPRPSHSQYPSTAADATDLTWVPSTSGNDQVDEDCLAGDGACRLAARAKITGASLTTCHLLDVEGTTPKICAHRLRAFRWFWPLGKGLQAVADATMAQFKMPTTETVTVIIQSFDGSGRRELTLTPWDDARGIHVWIGNFPVAVDKGDACISETLDKHFELYYQLAPRQKGLPLALFKRPFPRRTADCTQLAVQPDKDDSCPLLFFGGGMDEGRIPGDHTACGGYRFIPATRKPPPPPPPVQP